MSSEYFFGAFFLLLICYHLFFLSPLYSTPIFSTLVFFTLYYSSIFYYCFFLFTVSSSISSPLILFTTFLNQFCLGQKKSDLECYYEPLSKCTIRDALSSRYGFKSKIDSIKHVGDILPGDEDRTIEKYKGKKYA